MTTTVSITRAEYERFITEQNELRERIVANEVISERLEGDVKEVGQKVDQLADTFRDGMVTMGKRLDTLNNRKAMILTVSGGSASGVAAFVFWLCKQYIGG